MNLSILSVRHGVTTTVVWLVVMLFGLFSLARLKLDLMPDLDFPAILVVTTYTGASPADMETLVSRPIETAVASVERVKEIDTASSEGLSIVNVSFSWGTDMDQAETDVRRSLDMYSSMLPDVDPGCRTVYLAGAEIDLTTAEFDLLWLLARHAGEPLDREAIYRELRGIEWDGLDRSIDLRILRLRKKLGDTARHPQFIKSVRGVGYLLVRPGVEES